MVSIRDGFEPFRSENRLIFLQNLKNLSLRGGHFSCPTRQSLTERGKEKVGRGTKPRVAARFPNAAKSDDL